MRVAVVMLCSVILQSMSLNCSFAQNTSAEPTSMHIVEDALPANESVKIEKMEWKYKAKEDQYPSATITITNLSDKKIKRIDFSVIANDSLGVALVSDGIAIKRLVSGTVVEPYSSKTVTFDKAFLNNRVATMTLRNATIEYENGSIDIINNDRGYPTY